MFPSSSFFSGFFLVLVATNKAPARRKPRGALLACEILYRRFVMKVEKSVTLYYFVCDSCGRLSVECFSESEAVACALERGWRFATFFNGLDHCSIYFISDASPLPPPPLPFKKPPSCRAQAQRRRPRSRRSGLLVANCYEVLGAKPSGAVAAFAALARKAGGGYNGNAAAGGVLDIMHISAQG